MVRRLETAVLAERASREVEAEEAPLAALEDSAPLLGVDRPD